MRTVVITAPGKVEIQDLPIPTAAPGWVVVRVRAMGVCGTDLEILEGTLPYLRSGRIAYPIVPGHEWSGEVMAVGAGVDRFAPGDRVTGETHVGCGSCERCRTGRYSSCEDVKRVGIGDLPGGCAEYITVPAQGVHHLPDSLGFDTAAVLEPTTVALYGLSKAHIAGGEHVVVVGPGTIGLLASALARTLGAARVTLLGTREGRLALAMQMGVTHTINVRSEPEALEELAGRADVVVDAAGDPDFFGREISFLRKGGTLAAIGLFKRPVPSLDLTQIVTRNLTVSGSLGSPGIWERVISLVESGRLDPSPIITHRFPLEEAERAFHTAADHGTGAIKVVVQP